MDHKTVSGISMNFVDFIDEISKHRTTWKHETSFICHI